MASDVGHYAAQVEVAFAVLAEDVECAAAHEAVVGVVVDSLKPHSALKAVESLSGYAFEPLWVLYVHLTHHTVTGWSSLMLSVWFLGSLILMSIGIVGEYIGKIFVEVKRRPRYNIEEEIF